MPSTVIDSFDYDIDRRELQVVFRSGRVYAYLDVPPELPPAMRAARSKGRFFNQNVRSAFRYIAVARVVTEGDR